MTDKDLSAIAHKTPVTGLTDTAAPLDLARLRQYRLGRVREQLEARDCAGCLLIDPINIRYATGSRNYSLFQAHTPGRYLFVATRGPIVLFDAVACHETARGLGTITEFRPALPFSYFFSGSRLQESIEAWAAELASLFHSAAGGSKRLAVDRLDVASASALARHGIELVDAQAPLERARSIKSAEEVLCMNYSLAVADIAMARMREALRPGLTENELFAVLYHTNIAMGGEWIDARMLTSGDRTNPWLQEASERRIRPGELVAFDARFRHQCSTRVPRNPKTLHGFRFVLASFRGYSPDHDLARAAAISACVAQFVAAAEMNWSLPYGKPLSKCGCSGMARLRTNHDPSPCWVFNRNSMPRW